MSKHQTFHPFLGAGRPAGMSFVLVGLLLLASPGSLHCSTMTHQDTIPEEALRRLSLAGESYVSEELKKALYGVRQMKEVLGENEEEHKSLMKSLRHSSQKKKEQAEMAQQVQQRLTEVEQRCEVLLSASWEECRSCLEDTCRTFYTSNCRRGFASFSLKVRDFFRRITWRFGPQQSAQDMIPKQHPEDPDMEVMRMEDSFGRLLAQMEALYDGSLVLVTRLHKHLGEAFQMAFAANNSQSPTAAPGALDVSFFEGISLEGILESFFDFGRSIYQELSSVIQQVFDTGHAPVEGLELPTETALSSSQLPQTQQLCRDLRRQTSECWQLQARCEACQRPALRECPGLGELRVKLSEVSQLLELSRQHYREAWQVVRHHMAKTLDWLSDAVAGVGWVAGAAGKGAAEPESIFRVTAMGGDSSGGGTMVEVSILNSPTLTLIVPSDLELQDPAFIQYVAQEALDMYKQMARQNDV